jgi:hypothetical protein
MKNHNIVILDCEIEHARKLCLKDVEGDLLRGEILYINAAGLQNGMRNMRDGHCFFGTVDKIVLIDLYRMAM